MNQIKFETKIITPEIAKKLLENNHANRKISREAVQRYSRDMLNGDWILNGDTICIDDQGCITDGQHRLKAVILSNVEVPMTIAYGVPFTSTKDIGRRRTDADNIRIEHGMPQITAKVVGDLRMISAIAKGPRSLSPAELVRLYKHFQEEFELLSTMDGSNAVASPIRSGVIIALHELNYPVNMAERFLNLFRLGFAEHPEDAAAIALRNYTLNNKTAIRGGQDTRNDTFRLTIGALIAYKRGSTAKRVARSCEVDISYIVPIIKGCGESLHERG